MTAKEAFHDLSDKYGVAFHWRTLPPADTYFVKELKRDLGSAHPIFSKSVHAIARSDSNDDVLYRFGDDSGKVVYRVYHLTYSGKNPDGYPRYKEFADIQAVKAYIEEQLVHEQD